MIICSADVHKVKIICTCILSFFNHLFTMILYTSKAALFRLLAFVFLLHFSSVLFAQVDTLSLSIDQVDKRFLDSNLNLLALHYNVDASKALIQQAKLWPNPVLNTDQNVYSQNQFFQHGKDANGNPTGQYFIQVEQLILTANKRGKQINLATTNARISELQLQDLLRNLRYQLHNDYYNIAQFLNSRSLLTAQLARLNNLQTAMEAQLKAGNISQKDYLRVQALVIGLQQDLAQADRSLILAEEDLKMLLMMQGNTFLKPNVTESNTDLSLPNNVDSLIETARQNNAYYLLQQAQHQYSLQNITYQKALASPDVTVGPEFDKNSNYSPNYVGLSISLPLPFWNRNQGNIKAAEFNASQQKTQVQAANAQLQSNVSGAYQRLLLIYNLNNNAQKEFYNNYKALFNNVVQSYQQRQISLLEFLDFADSYQQSQSRFLEQQNNLQLAKEELNYQVGTDVVK